MQSNTKITELFYSTINIVQKLFENDRLFLELIFKKKSFTQVFLLILKDFIWKVRNENGN